MKYAICYESRTGNTAMLAEKIRKILPIEDCVYCGAPHSMGMSADLIFVGFWTDKGSCPDSLAEFLRGLDGKQVFLFGTAGFGGSDVYFAQILERVKKELPNSAKVIGSFMCQGKMPQAVAERYEAMAPSCKRDMMLENFQKALAHPNVEDLQALENAVKNLL